MTQTLTGKVAWAPAVLAASAPPSSSVWQAPSANVALTYVSQPDRANDLAGAYLAGPEAADVTGASLSIDGGFTA